MNGLITVFDVQCRAGWNRGLGYSPGPQSPRFRELRRLFNDFIGPRRTQEESLLSAQETYAAKLLLRLLNHPEDYMNVVKQ